MSISIPKTGSISAFAMIVDINGFTKMVAKAEGDSIAQYTRDVLAGGIDAVERHGGEIVGIMGDAFYALLSSVEDVIHCCIDIAVDVDKQCEFISAYQGGFSYSPGGPSLKIGIEYGLLDISEVICRYLGTQNIFIGPAVNYASRITAAGKGNRCLMGPAAAEQGLIHYQHRGPFKVRGKKGEKPYTYYELNLDDLWRTGGGGETFWG